MKRKVVSIIVSFLLLLSMVSCSYSATASYTVIETYKFNNPTKYATVELFLGTTDNSIYSSGTCTTVPKYTNLKTDDYGNRIAIFDKEALEKNKYIIQVEKNIISSTITTNINSANVGKNVSDIYLKPSTKVESNNQLIINKANELTKGCVDDYSKIKNIFEFVNMHITYDTSEQYRNKGALSALKTKKGVCEEYACLFVALCRACNIPARVIGGYNFGDIYENEIKDGEQLAHAWAEVYLDKYGWLPVEATTNYLINYKQEVYWNGLLNLEEPTYIFNAVNNPDIPHILYKGIEFDRMDTTVKLNSTLYFTDISSHWAKNDIESLYSKKIVNGYEDNSFKPQNNVTRIEFLVMLCRSLGYNGCYYYSNIEDIYYPTDFISNWSKEEYDRLMLHYAYYANDYSQYRGAGYNTITHVFGSKLKMNDYITREEVVALMSPFLQNTYTNNVPLKDINDSRFKDDIIKSYMNNIIKGYEDGTFNPKGNITRAEMATVLDRYTK